MSFINPQKKQIVCKIVYYGPVLAGKSTTLRSIYTELNKDKRKNEIKSLRKPQEQSLSFDFLPLSLGKINGQELRVHLYTMPGPVIYDSSRRLVLKGMDGVVFVADSQVTRLEENLSCLRDLEENVLDEGMYLEEIPMVFQYNKRDLKKNMAPLDTLESSLNPGKLPSFESVASRRKGVLEPLKMVTKRVLQELRYQD